MHAIDWRSPRYGWWLWAALLLVLTITVAMEPVGRMGAILFTPVTWLPFLVGEEAWRWLGAVLLAWGVWRLCRLATPTGSASVFVPVTVLTIPTVVDAATIGQANLLFAALCSMQPSMWHSATGGLRRSPCPSWWP